jgi:hypothetical protein
MARLGLGVRGRQQNFGVATMFYPAHVLNVEFSVTHSVDFDFWVDQLEFF